LKGTPGQQKENSPLANYQEPAFLAKTLGDENRMRILHCLSHGKKSVSKIVEEMQISQPLVSHHLKELKRFQLVTVERKGPFIFYELRDDRVLDILKMLQELATDLLAQKNTF